MPSMTVERVREREARIAKELKEKGESLDPAARRALRKKMRRAQRKRRRLIRAAEKAAPPPAKEGESASGETSEA